MAEGYSPEDTHCIDCREGECALFVLGQPQGNLEFGMGVTTMTKANADYSSSAVNLTNPPQIGELLAQLHAEQAELAVLQDEMQKSIPQLLKDKAESVNKDITESDKAIRVAIDMFGSYQDTDKGEYAVKQRKESITYKSELARQYLESKALNMVLIESINTKALEGLVKGGIVTPEQARQCGEVKESFAYIIR